MDVVGRATTCSKCKKEFPVSSFGSKPMYSGYLYSNWTLRDIESHIEEAEKYTNLMPKHNNVYQLHSILVSNILYCVAKNWVFG